MSVEIALRHGFGGFTLDVQFGTERAGVTALFGPSGAGKTTIVNAIAGLFRPQQGRIVIAGRVVLDTATGSFTPAVARRIGYVFQDARLFPHMRVADNLRFGWRRAKRPADEAEIAQVVAMLGLEGLLDRRPRALSGGEKSRVALGRALLSAPDILLLDEPLAALDAARRAEILPYLERLRDETRLPIFLVSHNVDEVARLADDVVMLRDGRVVAQGSVFDLLTRIGGEIEPVGAVLDTAVGEHRDDLTVLRFDGGELFVPRLARAVGTRVRVRIRAEDIMLARDEPKAISANNLLPAMITAIGGTGQADIELAIGASRAVARITRASAARLQLAPGVAVFAVVKSVIVDSAS
ncbi:MAG: molybdenum ABC transporter ATP-binding protein [Alphaproteobacteria bacterium]|nr:molybdenum ABC transporter ATP-binding protein [Alphaproteobacteria bacterium]MBV9694825.1 molybdenum ABC transporter ATP-binding protein [Alphaproteobacteria bacterium]